MVATTIEKKSAKSYADSSSVNNFTSTALNMVMAQIADATSGAKKADTGNLDSNQLLAWASQPGMIRTYDQSGNPYCYYKLYSASEMNIASPAPKDLIDDLPPSDWNNSRGLWTDLNAPMAASDGTLNYPILDPSAETGTTSVRVEGFSITNPPGYSSGTPSPVNNPAPMPVKWLYQLKDGTIVSPTGSGNNITDRKLDFVDHEPDVVLLYFQHLYPYRI